MLIDYFNTPTTDRELTLSRAYDHPPQRVFDAWTDPAKVNRWWGPNGFRNEPLEMDVRPGGRWRYNMHGPEGMVFPNRIEYLEVVPPEKLVYLHGSDLDDDPERFHVTVTFAPTATGTLLTMHLVLRTREQCEHVKGFGAVELGQQGLEKLARLLDEA